jgi:hypothetical protein
MNKAQLRQLIADNRLEEAIRELLTLTQGTHLYQPVVLLSGRFQEYKSQEAKGLLSSDDLERRRIQIAYALLALVEQLPEDTALPADSGPPPPNEMPVFSGTGDGKELPRSGTGDGRLPSKMPFWFSVGAFAVLLTISLLVPGWAQQNNALFKTLLALAAAGVAATLPGFLNFEINNFLKAGGALAAFVLVFLMTPAEPSFALTVQLNPLRPSADYPPLKDVELEIWNKNEWLKGKFSEEGVADFKNLSQELIGKQVPVRWKAAFYRPAKDTLIISPPTFTLDVVPDGSLGQVNGSVQDSEGRSLPDVVVRVEGIADTTDAFGLFNLSIPLEKQKEKYSLIANKTGYVPWENLFSPTAGEDAPIVLARSKKQ